MKVTLSLSLSLSFSLSPSLSLIHTHTHTHTHTHRYGELIARQIITGHTSTLRVLHRDATLLRFFHTFVITTPQILILLYVITVATDSTHPDHTIYAPVSMEVVLPALGVCVVSFLYGLSSFVTSDRLSNRSRRVIFPAYLSLFGFYLCIVASRIFALTLFTHAFGLFVLLVLGIHWVLSILGVLNQKSQFCLDYAEQSRKERWWLEVPFALFAACIYQFVFFSLREGRTRYALSVYLVVTFIENAVMVVMFFTEYSSLWYAPASVAVVIGLFLLGTLLLLVHYLVFHPDKTKDWYWIGFPKRCCNFAFGHKSKSYRPHNIEISAPTLVNMNGQATNLPGQTRLTGLQPLTSMIARGNKTGAGQVQLSAPPPVIDSGILSSQNEDYYKKPRTVVPQQRSEVNGVSNETLQSSTHSHYQVPNNHPLLPSDSNPRSSRIPMSEGSDTHNQKNPLRHTLNPDTNYQPNSNSSGHVQVLQIPGAPSLGSSVPDSDDLDPQGSLVPESDPTMESYVPTPSQQSMGLQIDAQLESAFQALATSAEVSIPNSSLRDNANASNANNGRHDQDIDSPLVISPYDTLDKARREAIQLQDTEAILEENDMAMAEREGDRYSASPPNLPTPDFTDHPLLPGAPNPPPPPPQPHQAPQTQQAHQTHSSRNQERDIQTRSGEGVNVKTTAEIPTSVVAKATAQSSSMSAQIQMFRDIPAKRDYHGNQPGQLERHYFPEPAAHSTPNLIKGPVITGAGRNNGGNASSQGQSYPSGENIALGNHMGGNNWRKSPTISGVPSPSPVKGDVSVSRGQMRGRATSSSHTPDRAGVTGGGRQRGVRGGGGGSRSRNPKKPGKTPTTQQQQQKQTPYYAYDSSGRPAVRQNSGRTQSMRAPVVSPENRQLFGRALPPQAVGTVKPSPWQQQRGVVPVSVAVPPPPIQKPSRSPDRSKAPAVQFQTMPGQTSIRPRSYSEGTTLESSLSQDQRPISHHGNRPQQQQPPQQQQQQLLGPQYSQHFLGRSPGAPRRDLTTSYYAPSDRTQVLNLTWTSPRLHHDPAISGHGPSRQQQQQAAKKSSYDSGYYGGGQSSGHAPFLKQRSQTAYELGSYGNSSHDNHVPQRKISNPVGHHHGTRMSATNQNPALNQQLFHVPPQSSHTSRV